MQTIRTPVKIPARATYLRHVLEAGHRPGVLSGAELRGRAKRYASYWRARKRAVAIAYQHGIRDDLVLIKSRWARVWTLDGVPVLTTLSD